ncbi:MAG: OmpA family protein [Ignavibacteriales bacterium]|nr:MAG: OmpA family protein [Ignavibacteriales bacterium]
MHNRLLLFICQLILIFTVVPNNAECQFNDYKRKFGIQINGLVPNTEFDGDKAPKGSTYEPSFMGRFFMRFEISRTFLEAEVGIGYGKLNGYDLDPDLHLWTTNLLPIDVRLIASPLKIKYIDIAVFAGGGILNWTVKHKPLSVSPKVSRISGWTGYVPFGVLFGIRLSENQIIEFSGAYNHTFSDDINFYNNIDAYTDATSNDGFVQGGVSIIFVSGAGMGDNDKDGLTNREEKEIGTDPETADTDRDGLNDGDEVKKYLSNPLSDDTDGDGIKDGDEVNQFFTDPNKPDTDNDGLSDFEEVSKQKTDPVMNDTDKDGLTDGDEIKTFHSNPLMIDSDEDKLNDSLEVMVYKTNPTNPDTDGDGLLDFDEIMIHKTNPLDGDSDGDSVNDFDEINTHKTNPMNSDSDNGSVGDYAEIKRGTDPNDADDDVIKINVPIVLDGITFAKQRADITPESAATLQFALRTLIIYPEISVLIGGHTDNVGSEVANQILSQKRAEAVKAWLVLYGISPERITAVGFGESNPIVPNNSEENKKINRRVEFVRIK